MGQRSEEVVSSEVSLAGWRNGDENGKTQTDHNQFHFEKMWHSYFNKSFHPIALERFRTLKGCVKVNQIKDVLDENKQIIQKRKSSKTELLKTKIKNLKK